MTNHKSMEVVLKIVERCNINCTYCYMFNMNYSESKLNSKNITLETAAEVADFVLQGAKELNINEIIFILHGGEPLYIEKSRFDKICSTISERFVDTEIEFSLSLQTNATLIDDDWIELFKKHEISVSVSLDGDEEANDMYRIDHKGRGTYQKALRGYELLKFHADQNTLAKAGILSVINPQASGKKVYQHLRQDLNLKHFNLLLPMDNHDSYDNNLTPLYTNFIEEALEEWKKDERMDFRLALFDDFYDYVCLGGEEAVDRQHYVLSISSEGDISGDDDLKELNINHKRYNIKKHQLNQLLKLSFTGLH